MNAAAKTSPTDPRPCTVCGDLGRLRVPRYQVCRAANRPPLIGWNHYVRQVIGVGIRLPNDDKPGHPYLSIVWAKPARWWKR